MISLINKIKSWGYNQYKMVSGICGLIFFSIPSYLGMKKGKKLINKIILMQVYFTGNMALRLINIVALSLGAVTVLQLFTQLSKFGALDFVGEILNIVIVRELGPIITSFIVISRSGTAIAAELGTMMVNDEISALEMNGIDTLSYIVFPRIIGMVFALIILTIYFNAIGILGGFVVGSVLGGINFDMFMMYVMNTITVTDIISGLLKTIIFGFFISAISIYHGFQAVSSTQIPQVTTKAVMTSINYTFFLNVIITVLFYI